MNATTAVRAPSPAEPFPDTTTQTERFAIGLVVVLVAALGVLGMVNSFARVDRAVAPSFGSLSWTVPLGIDIGIAVFTGLDLVLTRMGMRARWLRAFPWLLVAVTVYLNVADEHTTVGIVAHAVLPGLWVIAVEAGSHALRIHAGLRGLGRQKMDRVRWTRWALAPLATVRLWRRMVLWEVTDYSVALQRERDRVLARCDLADRYGRLVWRWRAPRRERALYRLGELAPAALTEPASTGNALTSPHTEIAHTNTGVRAHVHEKTVHDSLELHEPHPRANRARTRSVAEPPARTQRAPSAGGENPARTIDQTAIEHLIAAGVLKPNKVNELRETAAWKAQRQAAGEQARGVDLAEYLGKHPSTGSRRLELLRRCENELRAHDAHEHGHARPASHALASVHPEADPHGPQMPRVLVPA